MIKREVLLRKEIRTVYSSERQERMKVYFELNERFRECMKPCALRVGSDQTQCENECEEIFIEYADRLKDRYVEKPERL